MAAYDGPTDDCAWVSMQPSACARVRVCVPGCGSMRIPVWLYHVGCAFKRISEIRIRTPLYVLLQMHTGTEAYDGIAWSRPKKKNILVKFLDDLLADLKATGSSPVVRH